MEKFDETEFKRVVSAVMAPHAPWRIGFAQRPPVSKNRRAAGKMLEAALAKAGLDVSKLDEMLAQDRGEVRSDFRKQLAKTDFSAAENAYRQGIEAQTKAIGLLTQPFTSTFITLDTAFLIWQLPHPELNIFIDSNTGSLNNFIKIRINEITGNDAPSFVFYFLWQNTNNSAVVINAASQLAPGGFCEIAAAPGLFSGDSSYLGIYALFRTMRWSGWGTDPMTGQSADQTYFPGSQQSQLSSIVDLTASGGSYFVSGQDVEMKSLFFQNVDVSQKSNSRSRTCCCGIRGLVQFKLWIRHWGQCRRPCKCRLQYRQQCRLLPICVVGAIFSHWPIRNLCPRFLSLV